MLLAFQARVAQGGFPPPPPDPGPERVGSPRRLDQSAWGFAGSIFLHLLVVLLLIFGLPGPGQPPALDTAIPIDLVSAGTPTQSPPAPEEAKLPKVTPDTASQPAPSPQPAEAPAPQPKDEPTKSGIAPHIDPLAELVPPKKPPPPVVGTAAELRPARPAVRAAPLPPSDTAASAGLPSDEVSIGSDPNANGPAAYNVKDLIRTQIERRWEFDVSRPGASDLSVAIHIVVDPDGTVNKAEIVSDPQHASDPGYHDLAISARNAALVSSPLKLPPGALKDMGDMVLVFSPRDVLR
jgi:outer membrane biosynthesis protein TonB